MGGAHHDVQIVAVVLGRQRANVVPAGRVLEGNIQPWALAVVQKAAAVGVGLAGLLTAGEAAAARAAQAVDVVEVAVGVVLCSSEQRRERSEC